MFKLIFRVFVCAAVFLFVAHMWRYVPFHGAVTFGAIVLPYYVLAASAVSAYTYRQI